MEQVCSQRIHEFVLKSARESLNADAAQLYAENKPIENAQGESECPKCNRRVTMTLDSNKAPIIHWS